MVAHKKKIQTYKQKAVKSRISTSKLNVVYLAQLLVVMTDGLKIVRICAGNVPRIHGHKRLTTTRFLHLSLAPGKRRCRVLMRRGAVLLKHKKSSPETCTCLTVAYEEESFHESMPSSL